jgi:outer membrane lipoprotein-sorting protein
MLNRSVAGALFAMSLAGLSAAPIHAQSLLNPAPPASSAPARGTPTDEAHATPDPADVVKKYEVAMGGRDAWSHFNTRYMKGIYQTEDQSAFAAVEIYSKAPNLRYMKIAAPNGAAVREVCNGKTGWLEAPNGAMLELTGAALVAWVHEAEFNRGATLLLDLPPGKTVATAQVGKYSTLVIDFQPAKNISSKVYFDSVSGFVVRVDDTVHAADGSDYVVQTYLDDYRPVDGVFFAYKYKHVERGRVFSVHFTRVENNVAVDDSLFMKPDVVITSR